MRRLLSVEFVRWRWAFVLGVAIAGGCHTEADTARRADVARVAHAADVLRNAPNDAKEPLVLELAHTRCRSQDACRLKRACLAAYQRELKALEGVAAVRHALAADGGRAQAERAGSLLALSERELEQAHRLSRRCADLEGKLERRYKF